MAKIVIHDFGSYSFPIQLARELARRGHRVDYARSDFYEVKGQLQQRPDDPAGFRIHTVSLGEKHQKYQFQKRAHQEWRYGRKLGRWVKELGPEVVLSCNTPLIAAHQLVTACGKSGIRYIHWAQDLHSLAIRDVLSRKYGWIGTVAAKIFDRMEKRVIEAAEATVVISPDFLTELEELGIRTRRSVVIPNWMPLDEMVPTPQTNDWARRHGLDQTINLMYVGTLSLKHDAEPFLRLARFLQSDTRVRVIVVSAGIVFDELVEAKRTEKLENLVLLGWQKYEELSMVLGTGTVLFATVSEEASRFSIPCKVLTYASAGKPVLGYMPKDNAVSKILEDQHFGISVGLGDVRGLEEAANRLLNDPLVREKMGRCGRDFAERDFQIDKKADEFEGIFKS